MLGHLIVKSSRTRRLLIGVLVFLANLPLSAQDSVAAAVKKDTDIAVQAMKVWMAIVDKSEYAKSWDDASHSFPKSVTREKWVEMVKSAREPLGGANERKLIGAIYQTGILTANGISPGQFVIAQFDASFAKLPKARETVTFEKEPDGTWRAAGYYIKPN